MTTNQLTTSTITESPLKNFESKINKPLKAAGLEILQMNLGYRCNLSCQHCHVNAGPDRKEIMSKEIMNQCLKIIKESSVNTIDITGGAPEMHPDFRWFIKECVKLKRRLLVRSNAVILLNNGYQELIDLYARLHVELVVSLPCYTRENTDQQRGGGVFDKEIQALQALNA